MDAVELIETPSDARRRLSAVMSADAVEAAADVARHRSSVSFTKEVEGTITQDKGQETNGDANDRRVSVAGRRASAFSRVFALSSVSESFAEKNSVLPLSTP